MYVDQFIVNILLQYVLGLKPMETHGKHRTPTCMGTVFVGMGTGTKKYTHGLPMSHPNHVHLIFYNQMKNHSHPFPSSFRARGGERVVIHYQFLSHIAKKCGALVSSVAVQNALCSCIAGSGVQRAYWSQLRLCCCCCHKGAARCCCHWHQGP